MFCLNCSSEVVQKTCDRKQCNTYQCLICTSEFFEEAGAFRFGHNNYDCYKDDASSSSEEDELPMLDEDDLPDLVEDQPAFGACDNTRSGARGGARSGAHTGARDNTFGSSFNWNLDEALDNALEQELNGTLNGAFNDDSKAPPAKIAKRFVAKKRKIVNNIPSDNSNTVVKKKLDKGKIISAKKPVKKLNAKPPVDINKAILDMSKALDNLQQLQGILQALSNAGGSIENY
jgi:hypothetical protein